MTSPFREHHDMYLQRFAQSGQPKIIGRPRIVEARRKDGSVVPITLHVSVATS